MNPGQCGPEVVALYALRNPPPVMEVEEPG
jgi:hypothetical protein